MVSESGSNYGRSHPATWAAKELWWRKLRKRDQMRRLRRLQGSKSRAEYETNSNSRTKPWLAARMSRRTWYRQRGTSPCQVKLTKAEHTLVPAQKRQVSKKWSGEKEPTMSSAVITLQAEKPERTVTDIDRLLLARTCARRDDLRGMPQDLSW